MYPNLVATRVKGIKNAKASLHNFRFVEHRMEGRKGILNRAQPAPHTKRLKDNVATTESIHPQYLILFE